MDFKSIPVERKQILKTINVMSNVLSFLDHTQFNLMKLTRIIIDFGWYPYVKYLLELYYSNLPTHNILLEELMKREHIPNNTIISGMYLLVMMGYIRTFNGNSKKYYLLSKQDYNIIYNLDKHLLIKYDCSEVELMKDICNYDSKEYNDGKHSMFIKNNSRQYFDININTLTFIDKKKYKFVFAKSIKDMLHKNAKIVNDYDFRGKDNHIQEVTNLIEYGIQIIDTHVLIDYDTQNYKIILHDKYDIPIQYMADVVPKVIQDMAIDRILHLFNNDSICYLYETKICDNGLYTLKLIKRFNKYYYNICKNYPGTYAINDINLVIRDLDQLSLLYKTGMSIKFNIFGEDVLFVDLKDLNNIDKEMIRNKYSKPVYHTSRTTSLSQIDWLLDDLT